MNTVTEPKTLDQAQRIYTLTEFIKRIRIKTSAGESIEPELAQAMHYINEDHDTEWEQRWPNSETPAYAEPYAYEVPLARGYGTELVFAGWFKQRGEKPYGNPLYTTPQASASAASKLTDEEITELWISAGQRPRWFARAIEQRTQASAGVKVPPCNDVWYWLNRMSDEDIGQMAKQWPGAAERVRQLLNADVLFASSATTAEPSRWQPIETAPGGGRAFIASGHDHGYVTKPRHYVVAFNDGRGIIDVADGKPLSYLTHWMPLPAPPSDSLGGED